MTVLRLHQHIVAVPRAKDLRALQAPLSFSIGRGERLALTGPSGCGKSTLLRAIARAIHAPTPEASIQVLTCNSIYLPQSDFLFPWYTPRQNHHAWLKTSSCSSDDLSWARRVGVDALLDRRFSKLSGGERQRVGLWLLLCSDAELALIDEPFTALDLRRKFACMEALNDWLDAKPRSLFLVSHDFEVLTFLAHKVLMLAPDAASPSQLIALGPEPPANRSEYLQKHREFSYEHLMRAIAGAPSTAAPSQQ